MNHTVTVPASASAEARLTLCPACRPSTNVHRRPRRAVAVVAAASACVAVAAVLAVAAARAAAGAVAGHWDLLVGLGACAALFAAAVASRGRR